MEAFGNEYYVNQGEDWNLDMLLSASNKEYIPYIISSDFEHAFFVVTVGSTKFEKNLRYVKSWWNEIGNETPKFYSTNPIYCGELPNNKSLPVYHDESSSTNPFYNITRYDSADKRYLYQYIKEDDEVDPVLGHKPYYYFYFVYTPEEVITEQREDGYECHVRFNFLSEDTAEWVGQDYIYQITLVDGVLMNTKLQQIYRDHLAAGDITADKWPTNQSEQFKLVKLLWPYEFQPDINEDSPLGKIVTPIVIVPPTKLQVYNNIKRLI